MTHNNIFLDFFIKPLFVLGFIFVLVTSCYRRLSCDISDNKYLGKTYFSDDFNSFNIEKKTSVISFKNGASFITLRRKEDIDTSPKRLIIKQICESFNIKPYRAYSYYEYKNHNTLFTSDSIILSIEPEMYRDNKQRTESIYINLSYGVSHAIKASIPIGKNVSQDRLDSNQLTCKFYESIAISGNPFENIWILDDGTSAIYYNKLSGIVAIKLNGKILLRQQ